MPLPVACLAVSAAAAGCAAASPPPGYAMTAKVMERTQVRVAPDGRAVAAVGRFTEYGGRRVLRVVARRGDWLGVLTPQRPNGRTGWIRASRAVLDTSRFKITVDRSARRLTLRRAGRVVKRMTVTVGKASTPTPLGRFAITDKLRMAPGSVYGCCALALSGSQTVGWPACGWPSTARATRSRWAASPPAAAPARRPATWSGSCGTCRWGRRSPWWGRARNGGRVRGRERRQRRPRTLPRPAVDVDRPGTYERRPRALPRPAVDVERSSAPPPYPAAVTVPRHAPRSSPARPDRRPRRVRRRRGSAPRGGADARGDPGARGRALPRPPARGEEVALHHRPRRPPHAAARAPRRPRPRPGRPLDGVRRPPVPRRDRAPRRLAAGRRARAPERRPRLDPGRACAPLRHGPLPPHRPLRPPAHRPAR